MASMRGTPDRALSCSRAGCAERTERGADGRPLARRWLVYTCGGQVRYFHTEACFLAWRAEQRGATVTTATPALHYLNTHRCRPSVR
jgi:hypothetical protein